MRVPIVSIYYEFSFGSLSWESVVVVNYWHAIKEFILRGGAGFPRNLFPPNLAIVNCGDRKVGLANIDVGERGEGVTVL